MTPGNWVVIVTTIYGSPIHQIGYQMEPMEFSTESEAEVHRTALERIFQDGKYSRIVQIAQVM